MKKIRYYLAIIALAATLSGPVLLQGTGALANAASFAAGKSTRLVATIHRYPPCPGGGTVDC